ncbi:uncharacterized protein VTP21DRAFT_5471 [Calcarisporiella thermophila]|uniref:uncharacterized protein n=1 Tax=Calcarisporiella thermophila TaxID=911321 RepID=UPI0037437F45
MAGKKAKKMSLGEFLGSQSTGSWADDMVDLPSAPAAVFNENEEQPRRGGFGDRERDRGFDRHDRRDDDRFERRERHPRGERAPVALPTKPPFTAHIGNLPLDVTDEDVAEFFGPGVASIRLIRDKVDERPKGFGYVEFDDLATLTAALDLNGQNIKDNAVRVSVAEPPRERPVREPRVDRTDVSSWRRSTPVEPVEPPRRRGFEDRGDRAERGERRGGFRERGGFERQDDRERRDTSWSGGAFSSRRNSDRRGEREDRFGSDSSAPQQRKRLELQKRTVSSGDSASAPAQPPKNKPDPFGGARPIDTNEALRRVEERLKEKEKHAHQDSKSASESKQENGAESK